MSASLSVLQRATPYDVRHDPFPYIVVNDALPSELYDALVQNSPPISTLGIDTTKNNFRWNVPAREVATHAAIESLWKEFIAYHASSNFYREIIDLFYPDIHHLYPAHFPTLDYTKNLRVGVRRKETFGDRDILMDAMISGNTPVRSASSVRTTHIDQGRKLFSGLFYMRRDEDDSTGGDLTISRFKPQFADIQSKSALFKGDYVDDENVEVVETVKYRKNTLVIFINSIDSLHGVTIRNPTPHGRYFVNLVGESVS